MSCWRTRRASPGRGSSLTLGKMDTFDKGSAEELVSPVDAVVELESGIRAWIFWIAALAFAWAFLAMLLLKVLHWYQGVLLGYGYQVVCLLAAILVLFSKRSSRFLFAALNFLAALAWSVFIYWAVVGFARHFWK
jgi:hypothetical protein